MPDFPAAFKDGVSASVVAGLAQLGRMEEARAALTVYRDLRRTDLASWEGLVRRLFKDPTAADHLVDGLRKAGFE